MDKIFQALSSTTRRKILAYLSGPSLSAGEIAERFDITKPSLSKHLKILETAGLICGEKKGLYIYYSLVEDNLVNTLNGYVQEVCPVSRPLKKKPLSFSLEMPQQKRIGTPTSKKAFEKRPGMAKTKSYCLVGAASGCWSRSAFGWMLERREEHAPFA